MPSCVDDTEILLHYGLGNKWQMIGFPDLRLAVSEMLDQPEKTQRLLSAMKATLPFPVDLTPQLITSIAERQEGQAVQSRQIVTDVSYAGDEGGIICHLGSDAEKEAIVVSLTHVRIHRSLPIARAVIAYQKHRIKKLKKLHDSFG